MPALGTRGPRWRWPQGGRTVIQFRPLCGSDETVGSLASIQRSQRDACGGTSNGEGGCERLSRRRTQNGERRSALQARANAATWNPGITLASATAWTRIGSPARLAIVVVLA